MRLTARQGDLVTCLKHGVGLIEGTSRQVLIGGREAAVLGDPCTCLFPPDPSQVAPVFDAPNKIMAGMTDVLVGGKPLAARDHVTMHALGGPTPPVGTIASSSRDVFVGGTTTLGDADAARLACLEAAATRGSAGGLRQGGMQSFENCGCEATRLLVNGTKKRGDAGYVREEPWFYAQIEAGDAQAELSDAELKKMRKATFDAQVASDAAGNATAGYDVTPEQRAAATAAAEALRRAEGAYRAKVLRTSPKQRQVSGGTSTEQRERQLAGTPAASEQRPATLDNAAQAVANGKGIILPMNGMPSTDPKNKTTGAHIVVVTAMVLDEDGKPLRVIYNDPLNGCGVSMPAGDFDARMDHASNGNFTLNPIW